MRVIKVIPEHIYEVVSTVPCEVYFGADDQGMLIFLVEPGVPRSFVAPGREICVSDDEATVTMAI